MLYLIFEKHLQFNMHDLLIIVLIAEKIKNIINIFQSSLDHNKPLN